jgi:type I restriction enzyme M protein
MSTNEKTGIDQLIRKQIEEINKKPDEQGSTIKEIADALKGASKTKNGKGSGRPEFMFISKGFLILIEDKRDLDKLEYSDENNKLNTEYPYRQNYACNGAVHYAQHIIKKSKSYKKIFAIGAVGNSHQYIIKPYFIDERRNVPLEEVKSFEDFSDDNIEEYYRVAVLGELPKEERELREISKVASDLHESLRNYGQLEGEKKATVVSAILLALEEPSFSVKSLTGLCRENSKDGDIIFNAVDTYLSNAGIVPYAKVGVLKDQFLFLKNDVTLNEINKHLEMTPLKHFTQTLETEIFNKIKTTEWDILGNFYGEFVKYGGNDGNSLGIVLTPKHVTKLMTELIDIKPEDNVLDPACGTGAFLISAMNRMLQLTNSESKKEHIKKNQLYGIEIQQKLFTIATTNMILRGDGKSNLYRDDCFTIDKEEIKNHDINKVLINPPYSQAKTQETRHLSELSFIYNALDMMKRDGKLCAIVPQSTMVGKTKEDKAKKKQLLKNHTLEFVITLNKDTFHGVGTNPCIVIFTAGNPHPISKRVQFVNFEDDGYVVRKHVGLVGNGNEKNRKDHLLNVLNGNEDDSTKFVVKTTIEPDDEWLHSFYYFNEEIPTEKEFKKTIADYLTFQFDMYSHGRGYLFKDENYEE